MGLEQVTEVEDGGLVGQGVAASIESGEAPQQRNIVQRFFHGGVTAVEPLGWQG